MRSTPNRNKRTDGLSTTGEVSYRESLIGVTVIGGLIAGILISLFIVIYWVTDFPRPIIMINLTALLIDLVGLVLVSRFHVHKPAAHLITFSTYLALLGTSLLTGGIDASSMIWLAFIPIVATIMTGITDGVVWSGLSLSTIAGVYLLNRHLMLDFTLVPPMSRDRLIDLLTITLATSTAIFLNERTKARALNRLEDSQAMLNHLATVDPLTNAFNRRYFFDRAQIELEIAGLRNSLTSILLLDIDHFKTINDSYGHNVGDQILVGLVTICQESLRETDTLARLGGEEFVILLPETDITEAHQIAERLRRRLEHTPLQTDAGALQVTVSIGVTSHATSSAVAVPAHQLLQGADEAMYLAKRAGRNRVAILQGQEHRKSPTD